MSNHHPMADAVIGYPSLDQELVMGLLPRHRHNVAYATVALQGSYFERGIAGRWHVEAGQVVVHGRFESHENEVRCRGTRVLNVAVPCSAALPSVFTVADPDGLIKAIRIGSPEIVPLLRPQIVIQTQQYDWQDVLAERLRDGPVQISAWASHVGLAPSTVSRGFVAAYGVTPARFRIEAQALRALRSLVVCSTPLAQVAMDCGFTDQAHLCRSIKKLTGRTPKQWRQVKSVQDDGPFAA